MKKYVGAIFLSVVLGVYLGKFMLNQYDDFNILPVYADSFSLYFLEAGTYDSVDVMKDKMSDFNYYIYDYEDKKIHSYIGITKSLENAKKIKDFYDSKGYIINIRENNINNNDFVSVVEQYDLLFNDASGDAIGDICNQVLSSYEELVINGNKDEGVTEGGETD